MQGDIQLDVLVHITLTVHRMVHGVHLHAQLLAHGVVRQVVPETIRKTLFGGIICHNYITLVVYISCMGGGTNYF